MPGRADRLAHAVRDHPVLVGPRSGHACADGAHSYLGDGRLVCWEVPTSEAEDDPVAGRAVDAELVRQRLPDRVGARWSRQDAEPDAFWLQWCATEVLAKLADIPMVTLVHAGPVTASPVRLGPVEVHWVAHHLTDPGQAASDGSPPRPEVNPGSGVVVVYGFAWAATTPALT
ncbi:MAG: hypothetical protein ABI336_02915 [Humibacillus sp.]